MSWLPAWASRPRLIAAAAVAALALAFASGRASVRTSVHETTVTQKSSTTVDDKADVTRAQQGSGWQLAIDKGFLLKTHRIYLPNGTVDVTEELAQKDSRNEASEHQASNEHASSEHKAETKTEYIYTDRLVESKRPDWEVGAGVGLGTDLRLRYQADVARRIFGGLSGVVTADISGKAVLVGLRLAF